MLVAACNYRTPNHVVNYDWRFQESVEGIDYYTLSNTTSGRGVEYATLDEVECFLETKVFNYFESCMECYNNGIFVTLD